MQALLFAARRAAILLGLVAVVVATSGSFISKNVFYAEAQFPVADGAYRRCLWDSEAGEVYRADVGAPPICETVTFKRGPRGYEVMRLLGPDEPGAVLSAYRDEWRLFATPEDDGEGQFIVFQKYEGEPALWSINRITIPAPQGYDFVMTDDRCHRMNAAARSFMQKQGAITSIDTSRGEYRDRCVVREEPAALSKIYDASDAWAGQKRYGWVFFARR